MGRILLIGTERVGFIGAGRVGRGLSLALSRCGYPIAGIASRKQGDAQAVVDASDIVFLTVPDDALAATCRSISWKKGRSVVHCSGAAELSVLDAAAQSGAAVGGFHPLVMFADPEVAARNLAGAAIAVEAQEPLAGSLHAMVKALGARLLVVPPGARAAYHAGAHYAAAFACALLAEGVEVWGRIGIPRDDALAALLPLLRGATDAVAHSGPSRAMAGSIARGDIETVKRHVDALAALDPKLRDFYCTMALKTVPLSLAAGGMTPERAEQIRKLLL
ncbi:MAG TPA: DUF2520 domain-containing protein [Burkholderiales bacterium]|nr:DUF2520 domain-containing protein [Burkholderiales bacterium]